MDAHHGIRPELEHLAVPVDSLVPHPSNPNDGDLDTVAESLTATGQYRPLVVWQRPDGQAMILAGHTTWTAAQSLGWTHIARTTVEAATEADALRILLADNATARRARMNGAQELALLDALPDLFGTGYTQEQRDDLASALDAAAVMPLHPDDDEPRGPAAERSGLRSMELLLPAADHAELTALHARMRQVIGEQTHAVCALTAARMAVAVLDGAAGHRAGCDCTWCTVARVAALR